MSYQDELQRLVEAKASMRQSIINKGVEVPDDAKIEEYADYILQIEGGGKFPKPDLSKPLDKEQLDNLQNIVAAGVASDYLNLGDDLLVNYGSYVMPFEVVGFKDVEVEGGNTVKAINLLAKFTDETGATWGASGTTKYSYSLLHDRITAIKNNIDSNFLECLANSKIQTYSRDKSTEISYDKLFAPSMAQLGVTDATYTNDTQTSIEGPAFTAYMGAANQQRIKQAVNATSTAQNYWTRTLLTGGSNFFGFISESGAPSHTYYYGNCRVLIACNFIGNGGN